VILKFALQPPKAFCPFFSMVQFFKIMEFYLVQRSYYMQLLTTVVLGICIYAIYFSSWLPFCPLNVLVTDVFGVSLFLTVLASKIFITFYQETCSFMVPTLMNCMVIHQVSYWPPWGTLHSDFSTIGSAWGSKCYRPFC
jgi:hypothetical protein